MVFPENKKKKNVMKLNIYPKKFELSSIFLLTFPVNFSFNPIQFLHLM